MISLTQMPPERSVILDVVRWIDEGKEKPAERSQSDKWAGCTVARCVPASFAAYAKIFHPIYIDPSIEDHSISWHEVRSGTNPTIGVLGGGTLVRISSHGYATGSRVLWSELAQQCGLKFHPEISDSSFSRHFSEQSWPRYLLGPDEGQLDDTTCQSLVEVLTPFTREQQCWFYYSGLSVNPYEPRLYAGELADVRSLSDHDDLMALPEYWWPADRSWCVNSDWDLSFTLLAGPVELIERLIDHPQIEAVQLTPETRVDRFADSENAHRSIRQVAELALEGRLSLSLAARAMLASSAAVKPDLRPILTPFAEIEHETKHLPIGAVRSQWAAGALERADADIRRIEASYREMALLACREILVRTREWSC